jgi:streptogramin lyase
VEYSLPSSNYPNALAIDALDQVWYAEPSSNKIGTYSSSHGFKEYPLPPNVYPSTIAVYDDGSVWAAGFGGIVRWSRSAGFQTFPNAGKNIGPALIPRADGSLWYIDEGGKINRLTRSGDRSEVTKDVQTGVVIDMVGEPTGNVWYSGSSGRKIGRITDRGSTIEYAWLTKMPVTRLALDQHGTLWFLEQANGVLGHVDARGSLHEYFVATDPTDLTITSRNTIWVTADVNRLLRISSTGSIVTYTTFTGLYCN